VWNLGYFEFFGPKESHFKHKSHPSKKIQKTQNFENFSDAGLRAKKSPLVTLKMAKGMRGS